MRVKFTVISPPAKVRQQVRAALAPVLVSAAYQAAGEWQRAIPHEWPGQNGTITGNTARSITVRQQSQLVVAVGTSAISAKALEQGAAPHLIAPRRARRRGPGTLFWPEERGGASLPSDPPGFRLRKIAHHPGVAARGYGLQAVERQRAAVIAQLIAALATIP